jgi:3-deoxy-D-manno-octulosonic-acid transferase
MINYLYSLFSYGAWPVLRILPFIRAARGKEVKSRIAERFGKTDQKRPDGNVIWIHAASNGEALSALPLIDYFQSLDNPPHILMTTMTVTSANLIKKRITPNNVTHQFIPYDHPRWVKRFYNHWQPNMAIWIESELWPNHLKTLKDNHVPAILVNARLSDKSLGRWKKFDSSFKEMISCFNIILAQTQRDMDNIKSLGVTNLFMAGNLKDYAPALPFDTYAAADISSVIGARPTILFASTHAPEEVMAISIHIALKADFPNLLSIIVPRHPNRGEDIATLSLEKNLITARRSLKMSSRIDTDIYVADTLGELGLFYHLCPIVFIGNSMGTIPGGGHNLLEPAWHNCAILSGADLHNFSVLANEMPALNSCIIVNDYNNLKEKIKVLLEDKKLQETMADNARTYVLQKQSNGLQPIIDAIAPTCKSAGIL